MSLFTRIKNHLHTTFGCKDTVFQSKKFHILAEIGKRGAKSPSQSGKKSLIFSTLNQNWNNFISTSRNDIDLIFGAKWCSSVILYKFMKVEKGGQLWISRAAHTSEFVKIVQFHLSFAYIECLPKPHTAAGRGVFDSFFFRFWL